MKKIEFRKGALILFSEEIFSSNNNNDNIKEPSFNRYYEEASNRIDNQEFTSTSKDTTIKTVNDLQRNVLYYGITPKDVNILLKMFLFLNYLKKIFFI